jgi:hypothetical protein
VAVGSGTAGTVCAEEVGVTYRMTLRAAVPDVAVTAAITPVAAVATAAAPNVSRLTRLRARSRARTASCWLRGSFIPS